MALIGYLGKDADSGIQFTVSREVFRTPNNLNWNGSARYATHERHATHALTEFTGLDPDSFSFDILLTAEMGVNPLEEVVKLWNWERDGEALGLVIGGKAYGKYRWTIVSHKTMIEYTDAAGDMYAVEVSVELMEYLKGETHNISKKPAEPEQLTEPEQQEEPEQPAQKAKPELSAYIQTSGSGYTVSSGDNLWNIARKFYGDSSQWGKIYDANRGVIGGNPSLIYPGQVFTIPA